jgi:hypothetical protein
VNLATARVFATFLIVGTIVAWPMLWMTERVLLSIQDPPLSYNEVLSAGLLGAFALSLVWVLPGQLFVAVLASLAYSFFKRVPLWLVLLVLIPACGLIATYRDLSDRGDAIQRSDYRKLLYWLVIVTPGELLCARIVSRKFAPQAAQAVPGGNGS